VVLIEFISIANVMMLGEYIAVDGKKEGREGGRERPRGAYASLD
jgi:hypothetical protein